MAEPTEPINCIYPHVTVIALTWRSYDNPRQKEELNMVLGAFERLYGYQIRLFHIPSSARERADTTARLKHEFHRVAGRDGRNLVVFYYQGRGALGRDGHLVLTDRQNRMYWSEICNAILAAPCQVLSLLN
ncbi:hypothetical protein F5Y17DRAFT_460341 [Xylariaceae sp. FL0594]|nr:hypothetical protein F5Y17DRAFT_460341 [Xylariaceae sp. FL0594]